MKKIRLLGLLSVLVLAVSGCSNSNAANESADSGQETVETPTPAPEEMVVSAEIMDGEEIPEGMMKSYLTGEYVPVEIGTRRPD